VGARWQPIFNKFPSIEKFRKKNLDLPTGRQGGDGVKKCYCLTTSICEEEFNILAVGARNSRNFSQLGTFGALPRLCAQMG
jgi:hypothetical protein